VDLKEIKVYGSRGWDKLVASVPKLTPTGQALFFLVVFVLLFTAQSWYVFVLFFLGIYLGYHAT
jgi:hypothetical protein